MVEGRRVVAAVILSIAQPALAERAVTIDADARDVQRRLVRAHLTIPAQPGKLVLRYPKWIPGEHGPDGPVHRLSNVVFTGAGRTLTWSRDGGDLFAFSVDVPKGVTEVGADIEMVLPASGMFSGGGAASDHLDLFSWNHVVLYPDGKSSDDLRYRASLKIPKNWKYACAMSGKRSGERVDFDEVSLTTLVDSPVIAGEHYKEIALAESPRVRLAIVADSEAALDVPGEAVKSYQRLVAEAYAMFGAKHYKSYTFLLSLSDYVAHYGLEHHESSDNRLIEAAFKPATRSQVGALFAHEYAHSWNGKYRRPASLMPGRFDQTLHTDLLWIYEGLTEYLGTVLAARAGVMPLDHARSRFAYLLGRVTNAGRHWRPLADTATSAQHLYGGSGWRSRSRGIEFYDEGALFWLEVDATIRAKTGNKKSLDDFLRAFYGGKDTGPEVKTYTLDDVIVALDGVVANDWRGLVKQRVYDVQKAAPTHGIEAAGWKLGSTQTLPPYFDEIANAWGKLVDWSIGIEVDKGQISDVVPGSLADRAGIVPGSELVAVNGVAFTLEVLRKAVAATKSTPGIELLVKRNDVLRTYKLDLRAPRYPALERGKGDDLLTSILTPLVK